MADFVFLPLVSMGIFTIGVYTLILDTDLLRKIMALNFMASSVFLLLISIASRSHPAIDAIPHGFILAAIVIMVSLTALALMLARRIYQITGQLYLLENENDTGEPL